MAIISSAARFFDQLRGGIRAMLRQSHQPEQTDKSNPSAFILLEEPIALHASKISEALRARYPEQVIAGQSPDTDEDTKAIVLSFAGMVVAIMAMDFALPEGGQSAVDAKLHWPEAETVFSRHRAHIIVAVMGERSSPLQVAQVTTAVVGAVIATHPPCSGVLWALTVANSSQVAAELSSSAFAPYPDYPSALWISMRPFRDQARVGVVTMGLQNFVGREIELEGSAAQFEDVLHTAQGLVAYLLQDGVEVKDHDTIGASEHERILLRFLESQRFKGLPVIAASLPEEFR